jgi:hypothetical protein
LRSFREIGILKVFYGCLVFHVIGKKNLEGTWWVLGGQLEATWWRRSNPRNPFGQEGLRVKDIELGGFLEKAYRGPYIKGS